MNRSFSFLTPLLIGLLAILFLTVLFVGNIQFARSITGEKDFLVPWLSAQTFLRFGEPNSPDRVTPYSTSTSQRAQINYYGRIAEITEDPLTLWIPFPLELFYFPFALISSYEIALGAWLTLAEIALMVSAILLLRLVRWTLPRSILPLFIIYPVVMSFGLFSLFSASISPIVLLACVGALLLLRSEQDEMAGALLVLCALKPGIFALFVLFILLAMGYQRRWRVLAGFGMTLGILLLVSFIILPDWVMPFLRGLFRHLQFNPGFTFSVVLSRLFPLAGSRISIVLSILASTLVLFEWWQARNKDLRHILWTSCHSIAIAPLIGFPISLSYYVALVFPIFFFIAVLNERWSGTRQWKISLAIVAFFLMLGWILMTSIAAILIMPAFILFALYWVRWWATRPSRTTIEYLK